MSDDEDLEPVGQLQAGGAGAGITASQLAAALATAGAHASSQQSPTVRDYSENITGWGGGRGFWGRGVPIF